MRQHYQAVLEVELLGQAHRNEEDNTELSGMKD
jgi:hypothetical protein